MKQTIQRWSVVGLSMALFVVCLTQEGYRTAGVTNGALGIKLFGLGWLALLAGKLAWIGNPLLFQGWVLVIRGRPLWGLSAGVAALAFILTFLSSTTMPIDESGNIEQIVGYGLAYWVWLLSAVVFVVGAVWLSFVGRGRPAGNP